MRLVDPACGSGHFLLGAFRRLDARWARDEPGTNPRERARRVLAQIAGVDLNPFAAAVARFRLLVAALGASGVERLADAPAFDVRVAAGDALLHGPRPGLLEGARKRYLEAAPEPRARDADGTAAAGARDADGAAGAPEAVFDDPLAHVYRTEDAGALRAILGRRYHAVVGNPPYVTPKDPAINRAYRERFDSGGAMLPMAGSGSAAPGGAGAAVAAGGRTLPVAGSAGAAPGGADGAVAAGGTALPAAGSAGAALGGPGNVGGRTLPVAGSAGAALGGGAMALRAERRSRRAALARHSAARALRSPRVEPRSALSRTP